METTDRQFQRILRLSWDAHEEFEAKLGNQIKIFKCVLLFWVSSMGFLAVFADEISAWTSLVGSKSLTCAVTAIAFFAFARLIYLAWNWKPMQDQVVVDLSHELANYCEGKEFAVEDIEKFRDSNEFVLTIEKHAFLNKVLRQLQR